MRKKILLVEDNLELLQLLRLHLKAAGYSVSTAKDGVEALKKVRTNTPNLIILDLVLPELDGFAVCEILRKSRATSAVPVIMLTGLTSSMTRYAGMESGASEFVTKPISPEMLVSRIEHWLAQTTAANSTSTAGTARLQSKRRRVETVEAVA